MQVQAQTVNPHGTVYTCHCIPLSAEIASERDNRVFPEIAMHASRRGSARRSCLHRVTRSHALSNGAVPEILPSLPKGKNGERRSARVTQVITDRLMRQKNRAAEASRRDHGINRDTHSANVRVEPSGQLHVKSAEAGADNAFWAPVSVRPTPPTTET